MWGVVLGEIHSRVYKKTQNSSSVIICHILNDWVISAAVKLISDERFKTVPHRRHKLEPTDPCLNVPRVCKHTTEHHYRHHYNRWKWDGHFCLVENTWNEIAKWSSTLSNKKEGAIKIEELRSWHCQANLEVDYHCEYHWCECEYWSFSNNLC